MVSTATPAPELSEAGVVGKLRENTARFVEMNAALGGLFTQAQAALLMGIGRARVGHLVTEGRLHLHEFAIEHQDGERDVVGRFISGAQIERYLAAERKAVGRPSKLRLAIAASQVK